MAAMKKAEITKNGITQEVDGSWITLDENKETNITDCSQTNTNML